MKNNTIAIALGSLLLGGVATAGYLNNRDKTSDIQPPSDAAAAQYADAFGEPLPMDSAIPASGRVEYAQVVGELKVRFDGKGELTQCSGTPHVLIGSDFTINKLPPTDAEK